MLKVKPTLLNLQPRMQLLRARSCVLCLSQLQDFRKSAKVEPSDSAASGPDGYSSGWRSLLAVQTTSSNASKRLIESDELILDVFAQSRTDDDWRSKLGTVDPKIWDTMTANGIMGSMSGGVGDATAWRSWDPKTGAYSILCRVMCIQTEDSCKWQVFHDVPARSRSVLNFCHRHDDSLATQRRSTRSCK
eukprot:2829000-Amphidinium_carterae.1